MYQGSFFISLLGLLSHVVAQTTLDDSKCLPNPGVSSLSACNYLVNQLDSCGSPQVATGAPFVACYCNQKLFNAFFDCESEQRLCFGNELNDDVIQTGLYTWHSVCDSRITFSPSTPVVSTLGITHDPDFCTTAYSACQSALNSQSECSVSDRSLGPIFSTCFCQPELLSLQYTCAYMGNLTCQGEPAALTNIPAYDFCTNAPSVLGSAGITNDIPASASASKTTALPSSTESPADASVLSGSLHTTAPPSPGSSSVSPGPQSTSSSKNSAAMVSNPVRNIGIGLGVLVLLKAIFIVA